MLTQVNSLRFRHMRSEGYSERSNICSIFVHKKHTTIKPRMGEKFYHVALPLSRTFFKKLKKNISFLFPKKSSIFTKMLLNCYQIFRKSPFIEKIYLFLLIFYFLTIEKR